MKIRLLRRDDLPQVVALWNESCGAGETVLSPLTEAGFEALFFANPEYDGQFSFVWEEAGAAVGFISGTAPRVFLPGETPENTPGFLTCVFVKRPAAGGASARRWRRLSRTPSAPPARPASPATATATPST